MQIVIVQKDYTFVNGEMRDHWDIKLLSTSQVVAHIDQISPITDTSPGKYQLTTYGESKHGNRYRVFEGMDKTTDVVMKWAKRRFRDKKEQ